MISKLKQFNGEYGCGYCKHPGKPIPKIKKDGTLGRDIRVFPLEFPLPEKRSHETTLREAIEAVNSSCSVYGVKGPSILHLLPGFNLISGMIPDYMHCVLIGVVHQFVNLWIESPNTAYYWKNPSKTDDILNKVKPPSDIRRIFRSLSQFFPLWKASEFRNFFLFYSPAVLKSVLPREYYNHWLLLVNAFRLLLKKSVTPTDVHTARLLIYKFVSQTAHLYGEQQLSYNVHILSHVVDSVEDWGAPWASSAFIYEDAGGKLKNMFHGTRFVARQMFSNFFRSRKLADFSVHFIPFVEDDVKDFYESLDGPINAAPTTSNVINMRPLGKCCNKNNLMVSELLAIERLVGQGDEQYELHCKTACRYDRLWVNGKVYCTKEYYSKTKRDNSLVTLKNKIGLFRVSQIIVYFPNCSCLMGGPPICKPYTDPSSKILMSDPHVKIVMIADEFKTLPVSSIHDNFSEINLTQFMRKLDMSITNAPVVAFWPTSVFNKCILIPVNDDEQIIIENKIRFKLDK